MKRAALSILATLAAALMMALSTGVALGSWDYEDCPPAAQAAKDHSSAKAQANWLNVQPPAAPNAWVGSNPGNK